MASYCGKKVDVTVVALTLVALNNISYMLAARKASTGGLAEVAMKARHNMWMAEYGRTYKNEAEKAQRFKVFKANADFIDKFNAAGNRKYFLATNEFADMSNEEFMAMYARYKPMPSRAKILSGFKYPNVTLADIPKEVDWTKKGAVTKIKHQNQCGCCWAFSAVATVESIHQIKTGQLLSLSEQQLLDCIRDDHDCTGGFMDVPLKYIVDNGGIATENDYPYTAARGKCNHNVKLTVKITGFEIVPKNNEEALAAAVAKQPVAVNLDSRKFQHYGGGVMLGHDCGTTLTHSLAVVGYGLEGETKYWLLKNQWGEHWGENGYLRLERGTNACGITEEEACYPVA
ncbi:hypothetical protein ACP4OV_009222 [Aristida adscensionis]